MKDYVKGTQPNLSLKNVNELMIPLPSNNIQIKKYLKRFEKLNLVLSDLKNKILCSKDIQKSLIGQNILMAFNELNSVEHYIIHKLSGINLNANNSNNSSVSSEWKYRTPDQISRKVNEVLVEDELRDTLIRLNPEIKLKPELADEVIYKLRAILISVNQVGLVKANEEFFEWLRGDKTMPFGENNQYVPVKLIDFDDISNNEYTITNQFKIQSQEVKIPDVVMLINGIPVVVGEAKTPIRPSISWLDGAHEVHEYTKILYLNYLFPISYPLPRRKRAFYGSVRTPLEFWAPWRTEADTKLQNKLGLQKVGKSLIDLLSPKSYWISCKIFLYLAPIQKTKNKSNMSLSTIRRCK